MRMFMTWWGIFGAAVLLTGTQACGRGGEASQGKPQTQAFTSESIDPARMTAHLDERGLPVVLIDGVKAVHASWVFWGADWKYADAEVSTSPAPPAEGQPGTHLLNTKIKDLGLSITGEIQRAGAITYTLKLVAADDMPGVIGGGIEFGVDLTRFPGEMPPEILPNNRGWSWQTGSGGEIRFETESPLAKVYFERGNAGRIRCFIVADSIAQGTQQLSFTLSLPEGAELRASEAERYATPDETWLPDPLKWNAWPIDVGFNNERPAGKRGRVRAVGDRLEFEDGFPARFWGVNLQAYALFSGTDEDVKLQADRIAAMGFNLVRIHHADSGWVTPNLFGEDGKGGDFDEAMARRIDRWTAALKERGVYLWLDLHVGRKLSETELTQAEGLDEVLRQGGSIKGFNYVNPAIEALMSEFARTYLERTNHITGIRYADEPAVIAVLLTNENDLTRHFGNTMLADKNNPVHHGLLKDAIAPIAKDMGFSTADAMRTWEPGESMLALAELERRFFDRQIEVVRSTGYDGLIATTNHWAGMGLNGLASLTRGDLIDVHSYGESGELSRHSFDSATWLSRIAQAHVHGMPLTISEWNLPYPIRDRFTAPLHMAAMASFQGWDAPMLYGYLQEPLQSPKRAREWSAWVDPSLMALMPAASVMFRDGHVGIGSERTVFQPDRNATYFQDATADTYPALRTHFESDRFSVRLPDTPELDFDDTTPPSSRHRVVTDPNKGIVSRAQRRAVSMPNITISRDWERGQLRINTSKSVVVSGWLGGELELHRALFRIETPAATVAVTALDNRAMVRSKHLLLTAVAQAVPGSEAGHPDAVWATEPVIGTVEIDLGGRGTRARQFDGLGHTLAEWVVEPNSDGRVRIDLDGRSPWVELFPAD